MILADVTKGGIILLLGMMTVFTFIAVMIALMKLNQIIAERTEKSAKGGNDAAVAAAAAAYLKRKNP
ncbi:MAG: hypothetical protein CVT47_00445 [Thermoplasmata archaeon HGW-Thermoplasmata-2]|nr:MAG: hypothetical protein CVT47_00445 [Thermoplasmata archaeon HGW-Thermoplasmata-2]